MLPGYMKGIEETGGIPVMLPLTTDKEMIQQLVNQFDGFLFTGGHDVDPALYNEEKDSRCGEISTDRDQMEQILFDYAAALDKPMLGICRGLQLFNVLLGGTLYQDLPSLRESAINHKQNPPYSIPSHDVYIEKGSVLEQILKTDQFQVNSYHHQGIKDLSSELLPVATAPDGLIEAVEMPGKKFVLAVQWHPEFSYRHDPYNIHLFSAFIHACQLAPQEDVPV